jgi:hypothetical protein
MKPSCNSMPNETAIRWPTSESLLSADCEDDPEPGTRTSRKKGLAQ